MLENKQSKNLVLERKKLHEMNIIISLAFCLKAFQNNSLAEQGKNRIKLGKAAKLVRKGYQILGAPEIYIKVIISQITRLHMSRTTF